MGDEPSDRTSDRGTALGGHRSVVKWFLRGGAVFWPPRVKQPGTALAIAAPQATRICGGGAFFFDCESRKPRDSAGMHQAERAGGKVYSAWLFFSGASPATC